jgi:hypothetical protein
MFCISFAREIRASESLKPSLSSNIKYWYVLLMKKAEESAKNFIKNK